MRLTRHMTWLTRERGIRVGADMVMVNAAFLIALTLQHFTLLPFETAQVESGGWAALWHALRAYPSGACLLMLTCAASFACSGFYTYGRAYRGRYKALVVLQAVSLGHLLFGAIAAYAPQWFPVSHRVVISTWLISLGLLLASRLWSRLWFPVVLKEHRSGLIQSRSAERVILVIGGAGYVGSALLPKLLHAGYRVRLLDLLLYTTEPIREVLDHPHLEIIQSDFRHVDTVVKAMRDVDAVIHLGAIVGDPACALDEDLTIEINLMATRMIAEVAKGCGVKRFIFASTCSVYGASDEIMDEHSPLRPVSLYARSKIASEHVLRRIAGVDFAPVILRFGTIYGLSGRTRFDLVINLLTAKAVVDREITVFGGDQWRPFLHVDDAALAVLKALQAPIEKVHNQVFNVGSNDQNYTITQAAQLIQQCVPIARLVHQGDDADLRNYRVDFSKINTHLGFTPQWQIEQGVQQVMAAFRSGQIADYHEEKYSNVKFLSAASKARLIQHQNSWVSDLLNETEFELPTASDKSSQDQQPTWLKTGTG